MTFEFSPSCYFSEYSVNFCMSQTRFDTRNIILFITFFVTLGLAYYVAQPLIGFIIMAFIIVSLFDPVYEFFFNRLKKRSSLAASLTTITVFLCVLIPVTFLSILTVNQVRTFVNDLSEFTGTQLEETSEGLNVVGEGEPSNQIGSINVQDFLDDLNSTLGSSELTKDIEITLPQVRNFVGELALPVGEYLVNRGLDFVTSAPLLLTNFIVFITLLLTLFPLQNDLQKFFYKISPLENEIDKMYIKKVLAMGTSMIKGTFVIAIIQGSIAGFLLWVAGVEYVFFWTLLSIFFSIIPVGAGIVGVPIAVVLILTGNIPGALVILAGNLLIVGTIDNVLRPQLVSKDAELHPVLTLIGIVGGVQTFGFLGIIYGPVIMILLNTTIDVYLHHNKGGNKKTS